MSIEVMSPKLRRSLFMKELDPLLDGLHRTARRLTRDPARADDVVQDAVLKAYRFFESFKPGTNFRAWMYRVLYTVFVNTTRERLPTGGEVEQTAEPRDGPGDLGDELSRPSHGERVQAVLEAVDDRIKAAVEELPVDLRTVFLLSTVEGLKYREIAEVMECPLGTVMSRLFRGRRMLQERLVEYARESGFPEQTGSAMEGNQP
jgi:RNA polymerase sigma-70 factor (ECF subfamily)